MNVELPSTGCNIINSSTSFYNYSDNNRQRDTYIIYDGVAKKQSSSYSQYGYTVTGDCLSTGDLVYKPELQVYFPILSFCLFCFVVLLIYRIFLKRLLP